MRVYGLTGGVGMGKSVVSGWLEGRGERVVDTDLLARSLVEPGQPALRQIEEAFGPDIVAENGNLDRKRLAGLVFQDGGARRLLEAILHPAIRAAWQARVSQWKAEGGGRCFVVIPLLFETGAESALDRTVCVACAPGTQVRRLRERGWSDSEIRGRIEAQWPVAQKMDRADYVIWNETPVEICHEQVRRVLE